MKRRLTTDTQEDGQTEAVTSAKKGRCNPLHSQRSSYGETYTRQETANAGVIRSTINHPTNLSASSTTVESMVTKHSSAIQSQAVDNTVTIDNHIDPGEDNRGKGDTMPDRNTYVSSHLDGSITDSNRTTDSYGVDTGFRTQNDGDYTATSRGANAHTAVSGSGISTSGLINSNIVNIHAYESVANSDIGTDDTIVGNSDVVDSHTQDTIDNTDDNRAGNDHISAANDFIVNTQSDIDNSNSSTSVCVIGEAYERWRATISAMNTTDAMFARHLLDIHDQHCENCRQRATRVLPEV